MELGKKNIILGSTLVFVFLLVIFNLELFSGAATKQQPTTIVKIVPDHIKSGDYINVRITPGVRCAERTIQIFKEGRNHAVALFDRQQLGPWGGYRFCDSTLAAYKSWSGWKGTYYVLVKDVASNTYVKASVYIE